MAADKNDKNDKDANDVNEELHEELHEGCGEVNLGESGLDLPIDLNEPVALDMVKGGSVAAMIADEAYNIGVYAARAGAADLLGRDVDPFLVVDALIVTADNVAEGWQQSLHRDAPASVLAAK